MTVEQEREIRARYEVIENRFIEKYISGGMKLRELTGTMICLGAQYKDEVRELERTEKSASAQNILTEWHEGEGTREERILEALAELVAHARRSRP